VAQAHDLIIISDEIYRDLVHDPDAPFPSPAVISPERTVITTGLSKNLALGGWRLGVARLPAGGLGRELRTRLLGVGSEIWSAPAGPVQQAGALAFGEPPPLVERIALSRRLHARVAREVASRFASAGASVPPPQAAFYVYPDFTPLADVLLRRHGITSDEGLAALLLRRYGMGVLPGSAFGDERWRLRLRVATSMLYGEGDDERDAALNAADPCALPWIAAALDRLEEILADLVVLSRGAIPPDPPALLSRGERSPQTPPALGEKPFPPNPLGPLGSLGSLRVDTGGMRRRVVFAVAVLGILLAVASCSGSGPGGTDAAPAVSPRTLAPGGPGPDAHPGAAWPTFGRDAARTGDATGVGTAGRLSVAWQAHLDGAVYGQPLLVGHLVIAATENDSVYALNASTGQVEWRAHVGTPVPLSDLPCGDIDPLGITGTPVYDQDNGLIYAVAETSGYRHVLVGVSVASGAVRVERDIPAPDGQPRYDQQRPALALSDGRVYVAFGGLYGDCGPYRGSVAGVPLSGSGQIISYVVPTAREGAVWGTAGPVTGPGGTLYVSVGNGSVSSTQFDGSDSVTALSPALRRTGIFAPVTWRADSEGDLDLGSTQPALAGNGMLLALGKSGVAYLLDPARLGGVGGQVAQARVCPAYGAASVDGSTVYEPCEGGGMAAISVADGGIRVLWRGPGSAWGSPVAGGGAVWVTDYSAGTLYELDPATGAVRYSLSLGTNLPHFASMSMSGSHAFLGTDDGVTAVAGA
ncbi:MAG TPA: aminotransferase class I/II-fold pyridoxal phosphate-dependent enzyme, partial [Streptosporangiaceae bacterium]|nr:aminotransferase class I/II-fold pyridoxal phosphate-dependent enzyme [Streptosporangiaceae bacterium]